MCRLSAGAVQCRQFVVEAGWKRHVTPRHATPRYATPRRAAPRRAVPRNATTRRAAPRTRRRHRRRRLLRLLFFFRSAAGSQPSSHRSARYAECRFENSCVPSFPWPPVCRASVFAASRAYDGKKERKNGGEERGEEAGSPLESRLARKSHGNLPTTKCDPRPPLPPSFSSRKRFAERSQAGCLRR